MEGNQADKRFEREELGELLKLFSALGLTVAAGITGCFLIGLGVDARLAEAGWKTYGAGKTLGLFTGLGLTLYWSYLRIARHLRKFGGEDGKNEKEGAEEKNGEKD